MHPDTGLTAYALEFVTQGHWLCSKYLTSNDNMCVSDIKDSAFNSIYSHYNN